MIHFSDLPFAETTVWSIKRQPVYRILNDRQWLDNFFDSGEILLSCFSKFRKHPDEMRGDIREGQGSIAGFGKSGGAKMLVYDSGLNAHILSTTTKLNDRVINDFQGTCAIKINNPTKFGQLLSKRIPHFISGIEGHCEYSESRLQFLEDHSPENMALQSMTAQEVNESSLIKTALNNTANIFLKHEKYSHQNEYRLIWYTGQYINDHEIFKCPEVIEFCEKIVF